MKTLLFVLLLAMTVATLAVAESPYVYQIPGASVTRFVGQLSPATADTFYFMAQSPRPLMAAKSRSDAWYKPTEIPVAAGDNGKLIYQKRRSMGIYLAAKAPFWFQVFYSDAVNVSNEKTLIGATYVTVDSSSTVASAGPASTRGDKYPCRALISGFPDSVIVKGCASGDSVRVYVGF